MSIWPNSFTREESTFENKDGGKIYYQVYRPMAEAKRVLVVHHGFGEHGGRYSNLIDALANKKYVIYLLDARGHGRSDGRRGVVGHVSDFFADLKQMISIAKNKEGVKKVTLMGHSMGAVISFLFTGTDNNQEELDGLITSGLAIKVQTDFVMEIKKGIGGFLANVLPTLTIPAGLDVNLLSHDKNVVDAYVNDPLVHGNISSYLGDFLLNCFELALNTASNITLPVFMFHGKEDKIALPTGTIEAFERVAAKDKTLRLFDGLYHETMNELPKDRGLVLKELVAWIDKH